MPQETTSYIRMDRREESENTIVFDRIAEIIFSVLLIIAAVGFFGRANSRTVWALP